MFALWQPLERLSEYEQAKRWIHGHMGIFQLLGCAESQKLHMADSLAQDYPYHLIVTYQEQRAKELYEEYSFLDRKVLVYPAKDFIFFAADIQGNLLLKQRMEVMKALLEQERVTVITTIDGCMDCIPRLELLKSQILSIDYSSTIKTEVLSQKLVQMGYERSYQAEAQGQFSIRGGIIDIYPLTEPNPFRIELWGDEIDSIRSFDAQSQRSIENLDSIVIYPAAEMVLDEEMQQAGIKRLEEECKKAVEVFRKEMKTEEAHRLKTVIEEVTESLKEGTVKGLDSWIPYILEETVCFSDYFPQEKTLITLDEPARLQQRAQAVELEFRESMANRLEKGYILSRQAQVLHSAKETIARLNRCRCVAFSVLEQQQSLWSIEQKEWMNVKSIQSYNGDFELLVKDLKRWKKNNYQVLLLSASGTRARRLAQDLQEYELNSFYTDDLEHEIKSGEIMIVRGKLRRGYEYPTIRFVILSEGDIFGKEKKAKKKRRQYEGQKIASFHELKPGDYVVHESHGLGIYRGLEKVTVEKVEKDYIKIEYRGGGNLYVPATQLEVIQKYASANAAKPKLNKLGGTEWSKTKSRVKGAVEEVAKDLVELYAVRHEKEGYQFGEDTVWQNEFEEIFPFEETEDQLLAIEATKRDMESRKIMDRLVCGDVGFGKTEIAIRAAFKAVQEGKQVVYLVPTTILAQQHYTTFAQRMKDYPVRVDLLCRFRTPSQQNKSIEDLKKGQVDILIGTHRILSQDVHFKDLGLLIVDEEQRFGVRHKETIKKLKENVDVLTLTATPIPRTLHMSLIGIRDMSVLEEAPMDRVPIQTYVMEYNEEMVREALNRELARDGQVYYVYNKVKDIDEVALKIAALVPEANVAFAHGQMREHQLEKIMYEFINQEIDVLVSTTIIETGLDISNVNTIIIHDADNFGLSQLYQLRGRVGRSNRTAYAFLMYKRNKMLKEVAEQRLQAIRDFTELGSGIRIAMRDLELRGAGNMLGERQHGHMEAVGYDLYCKMLNEAVRHFKGMNAKEQIQTSIEVEVDAYIPTDYIPNEFQKLDMYKRITIIENAEECDDMREELTDRFGDLPQPVENLLAIALIKAMANRLYITEVGAKSHGIRFVMYEKADICVEMIPQFIEKYKGQMTFKPDSRPYFFYNIQKNNRDKRGILELIGAVLEDMQIIQKPTCDTRENQV